MRRSRRTERRAKARTRMMERNERLGKVLSQTRVRMRECRKVRVARTGRKVRVSCK